MPWPRTSTRFLQLLSQCLAFCPFIKTEKEVLQKRVLQHLLGDFLVLALAHQSAYGVDAGGDG